MNAVASPLIATGNTPPVAETVPGCCMQVRRLSVVYGQEPVLRDIDLDVRDRRITAILGPSGCGKSTLLRSLNRTLELVPGARRIGGTVLLGDCDLYARHVDARAVRATIGIIHQQPVCFPLSIADNVLFGARFRFRLRRAQRRALLENSLREVGLWDEVSNRLQRPARQLSGGQQQRLCLARTLATQPRLLLMDEPCASLDPAATLRIETLIRQLKQNFPIIIVTHNMGQARRIADDVILMMDGRIEERGSAAEVFSRPRSTRAADFLSGRIG